MLDPDLVPIDDVYHCLDEFVEIPLPRNEKYDQQVSPTQQISASSANMNVATAETNGESKSENQGDNHSTALGAAADSSNTEDAAAADALMTESNSKESSSPNTVTGE